MAIYGVCEGNLHDDENGRDDNSLNTTTKGFLAEDWESFIHDHVSE